MALFYWFDKSSKWNCNLKEYYDFCDQEYQEVIKYISIPRLSIERCINRELKKYTGLRSYFLGDIQKVCSLKIPEFWPPLPLCSPLFVFEHPLPLKVRSFWLELPLSPSISILVKFREKKLRTSTSTFGWTQATLESLSVWSGHHWCMTKVPTLWRCLLYRESIKKSEVFKSKHEIHSLSWL